ncbi:MAG: hypothetical protein HQL50_03025 [Magnetococcales bacterium]|nr:hypothetical protein [Magnetococcales bacterium]
MELNDNARIAVVGGGPAGSLSAFFLQSLAERVGLTLKVDVYEPRAFYKTGPSGCNMCGGIISESLIELLATEGLQIPSSVVIDTIDTYTLHTDDGHVRIRSRLDEMRIASIFRGGGPRGADHQLPLPWDSFDWFLLQQACKRGARHIPERVKALSINEQGLPTVHTKGMEPSAYDFLIGAIGLGGPSLKMFEKMGFGYEQPETTKAFVAELYYGDQEVKHRLNQAMHVFLLTIPGLKFAALIPKGHYATLIILGEITMDLIQRVLASPVVKRIFPPGWEIPVQPCQCHPRITIGAGKTLVADRIAMIGDCAVSRLYKDGIGAAYRLSKPLALTAITHGVSKESLAQHYLPQCDRMDRDNRIGHTLFNMDTLFRSIGPMRRGMLETVRQEQAQAGGHQHLSAALWDTFTGSSSYQDILFRLLHPTVLARLTIKSALSLFRKPQQE